VRFQFLVERLDKAAVATMLAGMCTFLNVYSTQPLLPLLRETFHASELAVSLTVSATIFATALTAPIIGMIAERRGRKKVIVPALFLMTIPTALAATSTSLGALIFWRFAQGIFVPGVIAVMLAYVNEEWAGRGVGRAMSAYVTGTVIGGFLGRFISGVIATHWHWRATFLVLAALNLIGAFVVRAWLPLAKNFVRAEPHHGRLLRHDDRGTAPHLGQIAGLHLGLRDTGNRTQGYNCCHSWPSLRGQNSDRMKSSRRWARAAWARCIALPTRNSLAT
jgi:MFS family permease